MTNIAVEIVPIDKVKPHPQNYRNHPEEQIDHLVASLKRHGFYRNVVVANDYTVLAGHGIVLAAKRMETKELPVVRLDIEPDSTAALKVLAGDNEVGRMADSDDRALSELLKEVLDADPEKLLGTGFDEMALTNLLMVSRPDHEIRDFDAAKEWVGMPEFDSGERTIALTMQFDSQEERERFVKLYEITVSRKPAKAEGTWSAWWPARAKVDLNSAAFKEAGI